MKSTKDRIIEYIDNQKLTKVEFCEKVGLSNGYLTHNGAVSTSNLEKIVKAYPDIDLRYIVMGEEQNFKTDIHADELTDMLSSLNEKMDTIIARQNTVHTFIDMLKGLTDLERFRELLEENKPVETTKQA